MQSLRISVVEDDSRYRVSIEHLLRVSPGFALAGSFGSAEEFLDANSRARSAGQDLPWDICLLDIRLPGKDGIEAAREIKQLAPHLGVVMLTVFEDPQRILEAIAAGADGYLLKRASPSEILGQLVAVSSGGAALTPAVARTVLSLVRNGLPAVRIGFPAPSIDLTPREREVLAALVRGLSYKQVAHELAVSVDTVRSFIRSIYGKMQVHNVAEAVVKAIREGIA